MDEKAWLTVIFRDERRIVGQFSHSPHLKSGVLQARALEKLPFPPKHAGGLFVRQINERFGLLPVLAGNGPTISHHLFRRRGFRGTSLATSRASVFPENLLQPAGGGHRQTWHGENHDPGGGGAEAKRIPFPSRRTKTSADKLRMPGAPLPAAKGKVISDK